MVVGDVFVNEYDEDDIRHCWEFTTDDQTFHMLTLDEEGNNFRKWERSVMAPFRFVGWLLPEDMNRRKFDQWGSDSEDAVRKYIEEKRV
ncbi:MAG: hypothetical protein ABIN01_21290 [Ferruginibacter sp.]